ncbi:ATP-binding protein [Oxalobacteraceae bacterium OTU3REALA1]|nr:ATP-binding protein [Oxalobacteraceae bacterium OTU3REALA1]
MNIPTNQVEIADTFLSAESGSEMARLIGSLDWSRTPLGPIAEWPHSLRTTVSLCLASNFPINIIWGPEHVQIYNDGYRIVCGDKHPFSLGMDYRECWKSAWPAIGLPFERAVAGETSFLENQRMFLQRNGYLEETFFTFSLSPIRAGDGEVCGLFHPVTETTRTMLSERRTRALRDLTSGLGGAESAGDVARMTVSALAQFEFDIPFVLLYAFDKAFAGYALAGHHGVAPASAISPALLSAGADVCWQVGKLSQSQAAVEISGLRALMGGDRCGPYDEAPDYALACPTRQQRDGQPRMLMMLGVSARLPWDETYKEFQQLLFAAIDAAMDRIATQEQEKARIEALAAADRAKTLFFSNVSHEFRTPLTLMLGPLSDALAEPMREGQRERLQIAERNAHRLLRLVNSLLDFSRIEAGRTQATFSATDLTSLTAELASHFQSACARAGLELVVDCEPLPEPVYVDRAMWEKIVLNLLSNAFKFTLEGGIRVTLRVRGDGVELKVADSGVGIPQAEAALVFDRFHRVEGQRGRSMEGSGIGLSLVKEMVALHGGVVRVRSADGKGSVFSVRLKFGTAHLPPDQIVEQPAQAGRWAGTASYLEEAVGWLDRNGATPEPAEDPTPMGAISARILLADDNADMRSYIQRILEKNGHQVTLVKNGREALEAIAAGPLPDLVLTDVMMPDTDGFTLLKTLRAGESTRDMVVILLSARAGPEARVEGLAAGADDYMVKPFDARELVARIDGAINLSHQRRASAAREAALQAEMKAEERVRELEISAHKQAEEELREASRRKDEFLAMLAHELRNPLAPISAAAQMIGMAKLSDERLRHTSGVIARQVSHMTALIDDLLDVSRVTRGLVDIERTPQDVRNVVFHAIEQVRPLIESKRHRLVTDLAPDVGSVLGDQKRLVQIISNLLNNSAKYTPDGGRITVRTELVGDDVELVVEDNGAGIAPALQSAVFELFSQAERTPDRTQGGLGLGLALVKNLVELHGGTVTCYSAGVGMGSRFTVTLPRTSARAEAAAPLPLRPADAKEGGLKIMVVDDNIDAAEMLVIMLDAVGHQVVAEHNATDAIRRAHEGGELDVAILDIGLPDLDGYELARRLRADSRSARLVLVALTGYGQVSDRDKGIAAGFDHYLVKPVSPETLINLMSEIT